MPLYYIIYCLRAPCLSRPRHNPLVHLVIVVWRVAVRIYLRRTSRPSSTTPRTSTAYGICMLALLDGRPKTVLSTGEPR